MIVMQNWNSSISLLLKLQKFCHKSKNYKELWSLNYFKRCGCSSYTGRKIRKTEKPFPKEYDYPNIFKSVKIPRDYLNNQVIDMLSEIFEVKKHEEFRRALLFQKHLVECSETHLKNTALYLRELNFTEEHICFAPGILLFEEDDIEAKKLLIENSYLFKNIRDGLGFVSFRPELINKYNNHFEKEDKKFSPYRNRIYYIGGKLGLPIDYLTLKIVKELKMLVLQKSRLDLFINLLLEFKCRPMAIVNDLKVFYQGHDTVKKRLMEVSQLKGSLPHRLWWSYSSEEVYKRYYERAKKYENCFVDDLVEVLQEELQLSEEEAHDFISRGRLERCAPKILYYKIAKYKEEGFTRDAFIDAPSVFECSEIRILNRIKMLKEQGIFKYLKFYMLACEDNIFGEHVKSLQILKENLESSSS